MAGFAQLDVIWKETQRQPELETTLIRDLGIRPLTARLLTNRGLVDSEAAEKFLRPSMGHLLDPFDLPDMDRAARRIADAVLAGESIFVHGDYDVDGVTSTALYVRSLRRLGATPLYRVPHRQLDGYDLKARAIDWAHSQGAKLVITTDCGIQAREAVAHANSLGMTVIVTDHHEPGETLPDAYAVVNPRRHDSTYLFPALAGVGVAFKTMQAVTRLLKPEWEQSYMKSFLDLVACGTVADVMPLTGENRIFVSHGLEALRRTKKAGLRALIECCQIDCGVRLSADAVGFGIGPRINAAGRLDDAAVALDALLTADDDEARKLAAKLNDVNVERQQTQRLVHAQAVHQVAEKRLDGKSVIVVASKTWNPGVVGIVAGKLVEQFHRPAIVIGVSEDGLWGKGSARSIPAFDLFKGVSLCRDLLETCGGHSYAAGLSLNMDRFDAFEQRLCEHADSVLTAEDFRPMIEVDAYVDPTVLDLGLLEEWEQLEPFGDTNPQPILATRGLTCCNFRRIGKDQTHMKANVEFRGEQRIWRADCVAWGKAEDFEEKMADGLKVDMAYMPTLNTFNGRRSIQLVIEDVRPLES